MNPNQLVQGVGGIARGSLRIGERVVRTVGGEAWGIVQDARHLGRKPKSGMDDVTLARKVETEIFRGRGAPKATVNVNVVDGVVWLRGEVKRPQQVRSLEEKARSVPEVRGVENLLHLAKTPAPTRADTPKRQQRTRSSTRRPAPRRREGGRVSDDRTDALTPQAEPSPVEHASKGEGRTPAPLGAADTSDQPTAGTGADQPTAGANQPTADATDQPTGGGAAPDSQLGQAGHSSHQGQEEVSSDEGPVPGEGERV
jgi:BON domain